jgi:hypothetical protein
MRRKLIFIGLFIALVGQVWAQKKTTAERERERQKQEERARPPVLVLGNGNAAVAAAIQSAMSGVKTTILLQAGGFDISPITTDINSGIQATFLKKYREFLKLAADEPIGAIDKQKANTVLTMWTFSLLNLTIIKDVFYTKVERSGNNWSFKLNDGTTIRPSILITVPHKKFIDQFGIEAPLNSNWTKLTYETNNYRTSLAAGRSVDGTDGNIYSMYQLFIPNQENLVWISDPESMLLGQAAGATAAYSAFFGTKTSASDLRKIQGELVHYKLNVMPFSDVPVTDSAWTAIQQVGITGLLKAEIGNKTVNFSPEKLVTTEEIKQPLKDFYYKAQIWFDDYKSQKMTMGAALDMIAYVGNKSKDQLKREIEKNWKKSYQFKTDFEENRQINRRELAVLMHAYMNPFIVGIDKTGKVVR